jgi:outer membrane protein
VELRSKAIMQAADEERLVRQSLDSAWQTMVGARTSTGLNRRQVQSAEAAYQGTVILVRAGERTTFDLLGAETDLDSAQVALVESERQFREMTFQVLAATGGLTASALKLPVSLYDPTIHYERDAGSWFGTGN